MNVKDEKPRLLIVEDDPGLQSQLKWCFEQYEVILTEHRSGALAALRRHEPQVVLQDLGLPPDPEGVEEGLLTLQEILAVAPHTKVIVVTGNDDRENAVRAVGLGAYDFYQKPVDTDTLDLIVQRAFQMYALEEENRQLIMQATQSPLKGIIATSDGMLRVCRLIEKVAPTNAKTLLLGESGTGKELLARALHDLSSRFGEAFVAINCAAIPDNLLESELFGYEKGAFTGAAKQTPGKIERADRGTLFLDEIGDMPLQLQAKLLRFLQDRKVERLGGGKEIDVDVRVVSATNQNLQSLIGEGRFREDLFYRVAEVSVSIPPLREREGGVIVIARAFLARAAREHGRTLRGFTDEAVSAIRAHPWPGNVRELENKINSAVIMAEGNQVTVEDLNLEDKGREPLPLNLREARLVAERRALRQALDIADGNYSRASELLGITRPTFYDLIKKHGFSDAESRPEQH